MKPRHTRRTRQNDAASDRERIWLSRVIMLAIISPDRATIDSYPELASPSDFRSL